MNALPSHTASQPYMPAAAKYPNVECISAVESRPTLINICSPSYSGSTMLDLMLGNAGDCFSCGEIGTWCRPTYRSERQPRCACGNLQCLFWQQLAGVPESRVHDRCLRITKSDFLIDSTKELAWISDVIRWGLEREWTVYNVLIWKSPIDYAYSLWKRGKNLQLGLQRYHAYYSRFFELDLPWIGVNCERLVAQPELCLQALCVAMGIEYRTGREYFWEKQHHSLFGSAAVGRTLQTAHPQLNRCQTFPASFWNAYGELSRQLNSPDLRGIRSHLDCQDICRASVARSHRVSQLPKLTPWLKRRQLSSRLRRALRWYR